MFKFLTFQTKRPTLLMSESKQKLILLAVPLSLSFTWNAFPANSKPRMSSCVSEPCQLNPCPSVCYLHVLTKAQGKGTWAFPKKLAKALDNYLAKEGCLEDPFSKQILRNYQPCVSTPKTPEQHKECVKQKRLSITNLAHDFLSCNLGGTFHLQP